MILEIRALSGAILSSEAERAGGWALGRAALPVVVVGSNMSFFLKATPSRLFPRTEYDRILPPHTPFERLLE